MGRVNIATYVALMLVIVGEDMQSIWNVSRETGEGTMRRYEQDQGAAGTIFESSCSGGQ